MNPLYAKSYISTGDIVFVEFCDKFNWCKIKNKNLYIRGYKFKKLDDRQYILMGKNIANYFIKNSKKNNRFGYTKYKNRFTKNTNFMIQEVLLEDDLDVVRDDIDDDFKQSFFVYANIGMNSLNLLYEFALGYNYNETYFSTIAIQQSINDTNIEESIILSLNYKFNNIYLSPSIGLLGTLPNNDQKKSFGMQSQLQYQLSNNFSALGTYQYISSKYNLMIGLKYSY
jgi:hypothetical protein